MKNEQYIYISIFLLLIVIEAIMLSVEKWQEPNMEAREKTTRPEEVHIFKA